jgi:hypothetical protein
MKWQAVMIVVGVVILLAVGGLIVGLLRAWHRPQRAQEARFIKFTNGFVGPFAAIYSAASTNGDQIVQRWLASGTNVAIFSITNQQSYPIILYPYVGFHKTNEIQSHYQTFLSSASEPYGVFLRPGQGTMVEVAVFPGAGSGRLRFGYTPDYYHFFSRTREEVRGFIKRKPPNYHNEWFYSDWFDK